MDTLFLSSSQSSKGISNGHQCLKNLILSDNCNLECKQNHQMCHCYLITQRITNQVAFARHAMMQLWDWIQSLLRVPSLTRLNRWALCKANIPPHLSFGCQEESVPGRHDIASDFLSVLLIEHRQTLQMRWADTRAWPDEPGQETQCVWTPTAIWVFWLEFPI